MYIIIYLDVVKNVVYCVVCTWSHFEVGHCHCFVGLG